MKKYSSSIFKKLKIMSNSLDVKERQNSETFNSSKMEFNNLSISKSSVDNENFPILETTTNIECKENIELSPENLKKLQTKSSLSVLKGYSKTQELKLVTIGLASSDKIIEWAEKILPNGKIFGEVLNANTLHYKTFKPHKGGLFCERIFGPLKDFECACGIKQKPFDDENSIQNILEPSQTKRKFCPNCDVEYTWSVVRRYQLGYIQLVSPVSHLWYLKNNPSYLSLLLDIRKRDLESIIYCMQITTLEYYWRPNHSLQINLTPSSLFSSYKEFLKLDEEMLTSQKKRAKIKQMQKRIELNKRKNLNVVFQDIVTNPLDYINNLKKDSLQKQIMFLEKSFQLSSDSENFKKLNKQYRTMTFLKEKSLRSKKRKSFLKVYNKLHKNFYNEIYSRISKRKFHSQQIQRNLKPLNFSKASETIDKRKFSSSSLKFVLKNFLWNNLKKKTSKLTKSTSMNSDTNIKQVLEIRTNPANFMYLSTLYFKVLRNIDSKNPWFSIYSKDRNSNSFLFLLDFIGFSKNLPNFKNRTFSTSPDAKFPKMIKNQFLLFILSQVTNRQTSFIYNKEVSFVSTSKVLKNLLTKYRSNKLLEKSPIFKSKLVSDLLIQYLNFTTIPCDLEFEFYRIRNKKFRPFSEVHNFFKLHKKRLNLSNAWITDLTKLIVFKQFLLKKSIKSRYLKRNSKNLNKYTFKFNKYLLNSRFSLETPKNKVNNSKIEGLKNESLTNDTISNLNKYFSLDEIIKQKNSLNLVNSNTNLLNKFYLFKSKKIFVKTPNRMFNLSNNIYTVSFTFGWETEKDWRYFLYYNTAPIELQDDILNHYKSRFNSDLIFNNSLSPMVPVVGANLIQKLLMEYEGLELKKMSKQYQNILPKLNRHIRSLRQVAHKKSEFVQIEKLLQKRDQIIRRLKLFRKLFRKNTIPSSMILNTLPVLPPDLRPILKMQNQIAASDLNRFYQRILYRNDRLKKFLKSNASIINPEPSFEMKYAQRLLQEAVDNLIQNGKGKVKPETNSRGQPLKSLSEILKGKQGRFRQYLLGKRVDYSGRSVIVVGPTLKIYECGLPFEMAIELFLPFLIKRIFHYKLARTVIGAKTILKTNKRMTWELLEEVMQNHPILLNRAPTLHRLGIQAFQPKLILGRAILLHPLVCPAFNADFDGDQMAVHVPITVEARTEAWKLMFSRNHLISPATGEPMLLPSQDMVLGCYYLTKESLQHERFFNNRPFLSGTSFYFPNMDKILQAYLEQKIHLQTPIWLKWNGLIESEHHFSEPVEIRVNVKGNWTELRPKSQKNLDFTGNCQNLFLRTTAGRVIFNKMVENCIQIL